MHRVGLDPRERGMFGLFSPHQEEGQMEKPFVVRVFVLKRTLWKRILFVVYQSSERLGAEIRTGSASPGFFAGLVFDAAWANR